MKLLDATTAGRMAHAGVARPFRGRRIDYAVLEPEGRQPEPQHVIDEYLVLHPEAAEMSYPVTGSMAATLAKIRQDGFAMLDGMLDDGTTGAAVPVFDKPTGRHRVAIAAISVVIPEDFEPRSAVIPVLMAASRGLTRALHPVAEAR